MLDLLVLEEILVFPLDEGHHPALATGEVHVLAGLQLQLDDRLLEEVGGEDFPALKDILLEVGLDEGVVHFCQLVVAGQGQVEVVLQTDVVGVELGEGLLYGDLRHDVDLGGHDVVLLVGLGLGLLFLWLVGLLGGLQRLKLLLVGDELEGLGPIKLIPVPHL